MLKKENFTEEHIRNLQSASHRDPLLLERSVYAFGLLEAITRVGMPFIFKGGTGYRPEYFYRGGRQDIPLCEC